MKKWCSSVLLAVFVTLMLALASGCGGQDKAGSTVSSSAEVQSQQAEAGRKLLEEKSAAREQEAAAREAARMREIAREEARKQEIGKDSSAASYTMQDIKRLRNTEVFARGALEHIFDGTINKKGKATGYHYDKVEGSRGKILPGTRSKEDRHGVFTARVEVDGVQKNGFSSFYPDEWTPQEVVDAINTAYKDALENTSNPHGDLWIGYSGDLEIDMYLTDQKKIITAYPIYRKE